MRRLCGEKLLDLAFGDKALRYICESQVKARKEFGKAAALALHARLADLESIDVLTELTWAPVYPGPASAGIQVHSDLLLIVEANEANPPRNGDSVDWGKVGRLLLKKLERT
jgi:hypothetical protein